MKVRILLALILGVSLYAQSPSASGSISGRVFDADTGESLAGLHVGSREVGYSITEADGRYVIRGVLPQIVRINVREAGGNGMVTNDAVSRRVTVVSNLDTSNVDLPVRIQGSISGRVLDADGNPLQGIRVLAISRQYSRDGGINGGREYSNGAPWYEQRSEPFSKLTDDRGLYNITGLYPGRNYWILAYSAPASRNSMNAVSDAPADPQARRTAMVATYHPAAASFDTAVPVVLRSAELRENIDIRTSRATSYCLEATLTSAGIPAALRFAVVEEEIFRLIDYSSTLSPRQATSAPDGRIRVCDLYSGNYRLVAYSQDLVGIRPFTVSDTDIRGLTVTAVPPATLSGEIVWNGGEVPGTDDARVTIGITPLSGQFMTSTTTRIPSTFMLAPAPPVPYSLQISGLSARQYVKDIIYNDSSVLHRTIVPVPGEGRLRIAIGRDGSLMTVQVRTDTGEPATDSLVMLFPSNTQNEQELATSLVVGLTDAQGTFIAGGLQPEMYSVVAPRNLLPFKTLLPSGVLLDKTPEVLQKILNARTRGTRVEVNANDSPTVVVRRVPVD